MLFSILNATKDENYLNLVVTARTIRPDFQKLRMLSTYCSYVPYGLLQSSLILSACNVNRLVFMTERQRVYCVVRNEFLAKISSVKS